MRDPEKAMKACAVCGRPLDHLSSSKDPRHRGGPDGGWIHLQPVDLDHVPVPVDRSEVEVLLRCDFCNGEPVTLVVLAGPFTMPIGGGRSTGNWAACETCGDLARQERWFQLATRVHKSLPFEFRRSSSVTDIRAVHKRLAKHMTGIITRKEYEQTG